MTSNSSLQKFLKIMSIFYLVFDAVVIVLYSLVEAGMLNGGLSLGLKGVMPEGIGNAQATVVVSISALPIIIGQAIHFVCTIFVYRGAKNPAKMKPGMILYGILSAAAVLGTVSNAVGGTLSVSIMIPYLVTWVIFIATIPVYKDAK